MVNRQRGSKRSHWVNSDFVIHVRRCVSLDRTRADGISIINSFFRLSTYDLEWPLSEIQGFCGRPSWDQFSYLLHSIFVVMSNCHSKYQTKQATACALSSIEIYSTIARFIRNSTAVLFLPCDAMRCTVLVIVILSVCPSVRLSVRLSVTLVDCVHMVRPTIMISSPYGSPIILVSGDITLIPKFEGGSARTRALNESGVGTNWRFSSNKPPYLQNGARYDKGYY